MFLCFVIEVLHRHDLHLKPIDYRADDLDSESTEILERQFVEVDPGAVLGVHGHLGDAVREASLVQALIYDGSLNSGGCLLRKKLSSRHDNNRRTFLTAFFSW